MRSNHRIHWPAILVGTGLAVLGFLSLEFGWWQESALWGEWRAQRRHRSAWALLLVGTAVLGLGLAGVRGTWERRDSRSSRREADASDGT